MAEVKRLDIEKTEIKTSYCISGELRDDQVKIAVHRIKDHIISSDIVNDNPVAIVCYGPSLKKTWPLLKNFERIMTCSGAHQFLLEKGIVPTWHVDLDPRVHKVKMLGTPHKDVEYLMASSCHPSMWDVLEGYKVKLWHIYNGEDQKEVPLNYPRGEWILTGGNNVGQRCLVVARLLGNRNLHIFGMDCSFPLDESHHAGVHLNANPKIYEAPYKGKLYYCEPVMIDYARQFFHEINQLPDVKFTLYGEGLLQHMVEEKKTDKVSLKDAVSIAFSAPHTITPEYTEIMRKLHQNPVYGILGRRHKEVVLKLAESLKTRSIMDYGCGKGTLGSSLPFPIWEYDPAVYGKDRVPRPADLVLCLDVLQHVEPEMLNNVLGDLNRCSKVCVFAVIGVGSSDKELPDGRNAHLIQEGKDWWEKKLSQFFKIGTVIQTGYELHCVLEPLGAK